MMSCERPMSKKNAKRVRRTRQSVAEPARPANPNAAHSEFVSVPVLPPAQRPGWPASPPHTASNALAFEILMMDPLSPITRRERRSLLVSSVVLTAVVATDVLPTRISALGIELGASNHQAMLYVLLAIVVYFLCSFLLYAAVDGGRWYVAWHIAQDLKPHHTDFAVGERRMDMSDDDIAESAVEASFPLALMRGYFDFGLPVMCGVFASATALLGRVPFASQITRALEAAAVDVARIIRWFGG